MHRTAAEPRLEPLDQLQPFLAAGARIVQQAAVFLRKEFRFRRFQPDRFDRRFQRDRRQSFAQQAQKMLRPAPACGKPHRHPGCRRIFVQQVQGKAAHPGLASGEEALHLIEHSFSDEQGTVCLRYRRRQREPRLEALRRNEEVARLGRLAVGLIEFFEQTLSETLRDAFARQAPQAADGADAQVGEQLECLRGEADDAHRQRLQPAAVAARHPERSARRCRFGDPRLETQARQARAQLGEKFPAAAEIAQAALDFHEQRLRRFERNARRELAGPGGYRRQRFLLGFRQRMPARQRLAPELREMERDPEHGQVFR